MVGLEGVSPDVASALGFSPEKLWRVERGRTSLPNPTDLKNLLAHYQVHDSEVVESLLDSTKIDDSATDQAVIDLNFKASRRPDMPASWAA